MAPVGRKGSVGECASVYPSRGEEEREGEKYFFKKEEDFFY